MWKRILQIFQDDGLMSFSRVASSLVLIAWLVWCSFIVFQTRALPSGMWEISTVVASLYGLNKVSCAVSTSIAGNPKDSDDGKTK